MLFAVIRFNISALEIVLLHTWKFDSRPRASQPEENARQPWIGDGCPLSLLLYPPRAAVRRWSRMLLKIVAGLIIYPLTTIAFV